MENLHLELMAEVLYYKCKKENCISNEKDAFVIGFLEGCLYNLKNNR